MWDQQHVDVFIIGSAIQTFASSLEDLILPGILLVVECFLPSRVAEADGDATEGR